MGLVVGRILIWSVIAIGGAAALVGCGFGLQSTLFTCNPYFTVRHIDVTATGDMRESEIQGLLRAAGVQIGVSNLFAVDVRKLLKTLESQPAVQRAAVVRRLPGTLGVSVFERQPIAQFRRRGRLLLDPNGWFLPARFDARSLSLPVITGVKSESAAGGKVARLTDNIALAALQFLQLIATRPDGIYYDVAIVQLDYSLPSLCVHLRPKYTFRDGARVIVPIEGMEAALNRLAVVVKERTDTRQPTYSIDATYEKNIPVQP
ncbi:MAG: hypothetical protein A3K19_28630 [Lentisphaerae bacterium RIFOXYB12_FULL_65_16]|nr:MAG: hypothetical protein A3K18_28350 [Lentisphaerae bacterium RIFOXYA12_64_32]OGV92745.1 MAG: hypothetical protein A3K19_28630 [Lentisphaerae bacterium RIFOXYB12_FULL_65_16]